MPSMKRCFERGPIPPADRSSSISLHWRNLLLMVIDSRSGNGFSRVPLFPSQWKNVRVRRWGMPSDRSMNRERTNVSMSVRLNNRVSTEGIASRRRHSMARSQLPKQNSNDWRFRSVMLKKGLRVGESKGVKHFKRQHSRYEHCFRTLSSRSDDMQNLDSVRWWSCD